MNVFPSFLLVSVISFSISSALAAGSNVGSAYSGSSFQEVLKTLHDEDTPLISSEAISEYEVYQQKRLPNYPVRASSIFKGSERQLEKDAKRTVGERFDTYDRLPKLLHSNGVCGMGEWEIDTPTKYTGFFSKGSKGLFIGRWSVAMEETTVGNKRGFGIAGKLFPTLDPNEPVKTGNFFTVDVLMGTKISHMLDTKTTNEPEMGFQLSLIGLGLKIASALKAADENPMFRPLIQVASLNVSEGFPILQPKWIRLSAKSINKRNDEADFRNEILRAVQENGVLSYDIEVSDTTKDRSASSGWARIGEIRINDAVVSYGCDRQLHFAHPKAK